jgi:phage replication-related protein YjqB (UPF0714/DUF867 family)
VIINNSRLATTVARITGTVNKSKCNSGLHDLWIFEGLLSSGNSKLHITSTHYDDPIALKLVQISKRCLSLHDLRDAAANGKIQIGGRDTGLRSIALEELTGAGIPAAISTDQDTNASDLDNICNKTTTHTGMRLGMGKTCRESLFAPGCDTRELRKNNTNANFSKLVTALRKAMSRVN